jgi:hypothetical protein
MFIVTVAVDTEMPKGVAWHHIFVAGSPRKGINHIAILHLKDEDPVK